MAEKGKANGPDPVPGNVTDDTWTRLLESAANAPNGKDLVRNMVRNAEKARHN